MSRPEAKAAHEQGRGWSGAAHAGRLEAGCRAARNEKKASVPSAVRVTLHTAPAVVGGRGMRIQLGGRPQRITGQWPRGVSLVG